MTISVSSDMNVSLHTEGTHFARLWTFTRTDGVVLRITDHDENITVPGIGTFRANIGFTPTAVVSSSVSFGSQQCEITVAMTDDGIREADVRARKWANAIAVFAIVDWTNPTSILEKFSGNFGRITITEKNKAKIEVLAMGSGSLTIGAALYSMTCRNNLGDSICNVNIDAMKANFTVLLVTDQFNTFVADNLLGRDDGFYSLGQLIWDSGDNVGEVSEVQTSKLTNEIGLFYPTPAPIQIGDTGHVFPGCDKLVATCLAKFNNVATGFNGEPFNIQPNIIAIPPPSGNPGSVGGITAQAAG